MGETAHDSAHYRLTLLGPFGLHAPDGRRIPLTSKKGMALIALLAMARAGERSRAWLQDQLWGSRAPEQARASLRRELSNLRTVLADHASEPPIIIEPSRVRLDLARVSIDVRELEADLAAHRATGIGEGDFLEGIDLAGEEEFEDWLRVQRQMVAALVEQAKEDAWTRRAQAREAGEAQAISGPLDLVRGGDLSLPDRPSIAVLPFANLMSEADSAHLVDGLAEELSITLSRFSTLFVIAAGSSLTYRDPSTDRARICRELGVRYLLEGSVRREGDQLRVSVRLVDGIVGEQVWADRFQEAIENVFELQDHVAATVAPIIESSLEKAERRRVIAAPVQSPDAYSLYWRANALFREWKREATLEAIELAEKVLAIEPANAWAAALASFCHGAAYNGRWTDERERHRAAALAHYESAIRHGGDDPFVLGYLAGTLIGLSGDMKIADQLIERALELHPNYAATLFWGGWVDIAMGKLDRALARFEAALRQNPRSAARAYSITGIGVCLLAMGRIEDSAAVLTEAVQHLPTYPVTLAGLTVACAALGRKAEARSYAERLDANGGVDGVLSILNDQGQRQMLLAGYRMAKA